MLAVINITAYRNVKLIIVRDLEQPKGIKGWVFPNKRHEVYVFITNYESAGAKDEQSRLKQNLFKLCKEFPEVVTKLIESVALDKIIRTDLFEF